MTDYGPGVSTRVVKAAEPGTLYNTINTIEYVA